MTSIIRTSNGNLVPLAEGSTNRTYSIGLTGTLEEVYDSTISQNLFQLSENFANVKPPELNRFVNYDNELDQSNPVSPLVGQLWYDTSIDKLKVYSGNLKWESVGKDFTEGDFFPSRDSEVDVGAEDIYWGNYYGVHILANSNRFSGQIGVSHPDGLPAVTITGDSLIKNSVFDGSIMSDPNIDGELGENESPFKQIYVDQLLIGGITFSGIQADPSNESFIITSADSEYDLKFGSDMQPIGGLYTEQILTDKINPIDTDIILKSNMEPEDDVTIGKEQEKVPQAFINNLTVRMLDDNESGEFSAADSITKSIFQGAIETYPNDGENIDSVELYNEDAEEIKNIQYRDLLPDGFIIMWSGSTLPVGWGLCDGTTYGSIVSPDMSSLFCYSSLDSRTTGEQGSSSPDSLITFEGQGESRTTLAGSHRHSVNNAGLRLDQIPRHAHNINRYASVDAKSDGNGAAAGGTEDVGVTGATGGGEGHSHTFSEDGEHDHAVDLLTHGHQVDLAKIGKTFKLAYIIKIGV